jgi:hypothetical protein
MFQAFEAMEQMNYEVNLFQGVFTFENINHIRQNHKSDSIYFDIDSLTGSILSNRTRFMFYGDYDEMFAVLESYDLEVMKYDDDVVWIKLNDQDSIENFFLENNID